MFIISLNLILHSSKRFYKNCHRITGYLQHLFALKYTNICYEITEIRAHYMNELLQSKLGCELRARRALQCNYLGMLSCPAESCHTRVSAGRKDAHRQVLQRNWCTVTHTLLSPSMFYVPMSITAPRHLVQWDTLTTSRLVTGNISM